MQGRQELEKGFWEFLIVIFAEYTPKPYSNYEGPYISYFSECMQGSLGHVKVLRRLGLVGV